MKTELITTQTQELEEAVAAELKMPDPEKNFFKEEDESAERND
jgi:hypothetical protein